MGLVGATACSDSPAAPSGTPNEITEVPASLPPRTALEKLEKEEE